jgi:hypothetical protein
MKSFAFGFVVALLILAGIIWYYSDKNSHARQARDQFTGATTQTREFVQEKLGDLNLSPDSIKDELARTGQIIRRKTQAVTHSVSEATADDRITTAITAKLAADPDLSPFSISVKTTDGHVALSGATSSPGNIAKAIQLAMNTDGVVEVVSTIQVRS